MTTPTPYLRALPGQPVQWPYSLRQLQADVLVETNGATTISVAADPAVFTAAPYYLFPYLTTDAPATDPRTQRAELADPVLVEGEWQQEWTVRDATEEELAQWDALNPPQPQWVQFAGALAMHPAVNTLVATAAQVAPVLHLQLGVGLGQAAKGDPTTFLAAWQGGLAGGLITPELVADLAELAPEFDLPAAFVAGLAP